jgi:asparagine synthase (glutamine-hydrolysing)
MCGIAGEIRFNQGHPLLSRVVSINHRQQQRGPDGEGTYVQDRLALGHRRLKIFDLTDRAAQPMVDHELGLALVFNGEIYNFHELRQSLQALGYAFVSGSDTEVLLKAYHAWGEACVDRLHGMFAFAMWERDSGKLVLARDRLGIKPMYYADTGRGICFASTLTALLEFDDIDTSISAQGLHYYLTLHAVPEPLSILSGIRKLPPGTILTITADGQRRERRYWQFRIDDRQVDHTRGEPEWIDAVQAALTQATERQLAADVPVGVLLSGGLDSSLLVALAAQAQHEKIETFSIGFESDARECGDEFYYSDLIAGQFGTRHHKMFISNQQLADFLPDCVRSMSEPMISHDNIGFYLLSKEVAKHVKVVLSGQGADEIFAGYHWFQKFGGRHCAPQVAAKQLADAVADHTFEDYARLVTPEFRTGNHTLAFMERLCAQNASLCVVNHLLTYESTAALANGPLGRVDNMTMASSLEARVPFLDEMVVDLALAMPLSYKLGEGGKAILKKLGRKLLPREVVDRPKGYFPVPALKYLHGPTLELMQEMLSAKRVRERGIFDARAVEKMLATPDEHMTPGGASKLWQIGMLEFWLQQHGL